jgi:RNA polymerase sigma-70 factor, ECF subfamily
VKNRLNIEHIVSEFYAPVYRFALALAHNETEAADLTQETFLTLCKYHEQVREHKRVKSWLFTTVRRAFLQTLRARQSRPEVEFKPEHEACSTLDPKAPRSVDADAILRALADLEEDYRPVLELFYIRDLSYKEIATSLRIPIGTVMSRLSRGKEQLRAALTEGTNIRTWRKRAAQDA